MADLMAMEENFKRLVSQKRFGDARSLLEKIKEAGGSPARCLCLEAGLLSFESEANFDVAQEMLWQAAQQKQEDPGTYAFIYCDLSRIACRNNCGTLMFRLEMFSRQLWMDHADDPEVSRWRGPLHLNFANHAFRKMDFPKALEHSEEALRWITQHPDQWCMKVRAHIVRSWCYAETGDLVKARAAYEAAAACDQNGGHAAELAVAESRMRLAAGDLSGAAVCAMRAESMMDQLLKDDWQAHIEAKYVRFLIALADKSPEADRLADELRKLATEHKREYVLRWISTAYAQSEGKEVQVCGVLS